MSGCAVSVATALPPRRIGQRRAAGLVQDLVQDAMLGEVVREFFEKSGVEWRHSVLLEEPRGEGDGVRQSFYASVGHGSPRGPTTAERMGAYALHALPLAKEAGAKAIKGADPRDVEHLVTVSCTGLGSPGLEVLLIEALGLRPTVGRTNLGFMGCHGAINGLRVGQALQAASGGKALVVCVELCTIHFQYERDIGSVIANSLFADGAAAALLGGAGGGLRLRATGSCILPDSKRDMTWTVGDHGFVMTLSKRVPELIGTHLRRWLSEWLGAHGLRIDDVAGWAVHPGGPKILDAVGGALGLDGRALRHSRDVLRDFGNMSSPTVLFILERVVREVVRGPVVMMAFGPGLAAEAALFDVG